MKKIILSLVALALVAAAIIGWLVVGSATSFTQKKKYLYINTGKADKASVMATIRDSNLVKNPGIFEVIANQMDVWEKVKPGRYEIKKGESLLNIARTLRNNRQSPVNLVINKIRTKQDLARIIGKNFEIDSVDVISYMNNPDSLAKLNVDEHTVMTVVIPNTYSIQWTTPTNKIFQRLKKEQETFWSKKNRQEKAEQLGLTPKQVYIIASIVEEETNKHDEKGNVASVYINRMQQGMPLGADPTIKFALQDFSLKRIYEKHLQVESPYNTYRNQGLPPGPICTPSSTTIDAVLDAPRTNYLFFVAKSDFSGYHTFTTNYADHLKYAKEYQRALDELIAKRQKANSGL
ncbi:endolytic transglycosylase MltG [Aridibaculum aurantiacum]|uniref:endolytic transglycosylase MltG n=1 Tax=Aridibaculum aurantiacum TaxID=2810307 RepID=UPI001A96EC95|nr:endolytic transglycosylase MltG [Aridibaculum aurantiacum]